MVIRYTRKTRAFSSDENYFKNLGDLMNSFLKDDEFDRIIGVGISLPGIISDDGCLFINDANAAGFAEMWDKSDIDNLTVQFMFHTVE